MEPMDKFLDEFQRRYEAAIHAHEKLVADSIAKYETTVADAQKRLEQTIQDAKPEEQKSEDTIPPQAVWIKDADGTEEMMVLNRQAAMMFLAIFQRIGDVLEEVEKVTDRRRHR